MDPSFVKTFAKILFENIFEEYFLKNFSDLGVPIPYSIPLSQELTF